MSIPWAPGMAGLVVANTQTDVRHSAMLDRNDWRSLSTQKFVWCVPWLHSQRPNDMNVFSTARSKRTTVFVLLRLRILPVVAERLDA